MKRKYTIMALVMLALLTACNNPFVTKILPDNKDLPPGYDPTKEAGSAVSVPTAASVTATSITVNAVTVTPSNGQVPEYARSTTAASVPQGGWQDELTFSGLTPNTDYYVFARSKADEHYNTGKAQASAAIKTLASDIPQSVVSKVDFENDAIGKTYDFTNDSADPIVKVIADPGNPGQKSLQITSNNYNQAAVIPIHLETELKNYQTFSFRFRLLGGSDAGYKEIMVYAAQDKATFVQYGFGNDENEAHHFTANFLVQTETINFDDSYKNKWTNFTITISNPGAATPNLTGDIFIAIGIKSTGIDYLLDDLTFTGTGNPPPPPPPPPPGELTPVIVDFEADAINKTYEYTQGDNSPSAVKVVADPANSGQKSLQITTGGNGWNQAAIIPINLPYALSNYKSFSFRFYRLSGTDLDADRSIKVYAASSKDTFKRYGFGNAVSNANQFAANLLVSTDDGVMGDSYNSHWTTYNLPIDNPNNTIKGLQGTIYLAIGINCQSMDYLLDDLTFNVDSADSSSITPTTAVFDKKTTSIGYQDVSVTMTSNGNTLSSIRNGGTTLSSGTNYTVSGDVVTIKKEYLATQAVGTTTLTFTFSAGVSRTLRVNISDTTNSTISPITATFDLKTEKQADIPITMTLNGNTLSGISGGSPAITPSGYTDNTTTVTIKKEYLATLSEGTTTLTFTFNAGASSTLVITIKDSSKLGPGYDFADSTLSGTIFPATTNITATVTGGFLSVNKTGSYNGTPNFTLSFTLDPGKTLADYSEIEIIIASYTNDLVNNKKYVAYVGASGSNTELGNESFNFGSGWTNKTVTIPIKSGNPGGFTGTVQIGIGVENTTAYTCQISSIRLIPKP